MLVVPSFPWYLSFLELDKLIDGKLHNIIMLSLGLCDQIDSLGIRNNCMQFTWLPLSIILCNQSDQGENINRVSLHFSAKYMFSFYRQEVLLWKHPGRILPLRLLQVQARIRIYRLRPLSLNSYVTRPYPT